MSREAILILDFGGVSFMDSSGLAVVMGRRKLMNSIDGSVELRHVCGAAKKAKPPGKDHFPKRAYSPFSSKKGVVPSGRRAVSSRNAIPSVCCVTGSGFRRSPLRLSG